MKNKFDREIFQEDFVKSVTTKSRIDSLTQYIIPVGTLSVEMVLGIYQGDYYSRLTEALGESQEAVWAVLGDEDFFEICHNFILTHPSQNSDLSLLADNFSDFISSHPINEDYGFLGDLSHFEHTFWKLFHLPAVNKDEMIDESLYSTISEHSVFELQRGVEIFSWDTKIYDIWQRRKSGFSEVSIDQFLESQSIILYKENSLLKTELINSHQYEFLINCVNGLSFGENLELIDISADDLSALFSIIRRCGLLKNIK